MSWLLTEDLLNRFATVVTTVELSQTSGLLNDTEPKLFIINQIHLNLLLTMRNSIYPVIIHNMHFINGKYTFSGSLLLTQWTYM